MAEFIRESRGGEQRQEEGNKEDEFGEFGEGEVVTPPVIEFDWSYLGTPKKE